MQSASYDSSIPVSSPLNFRSRSQVLQSIASSLGQVPRVTASVPKTFRHAVAASHRRRRRTHSRGHADPSSDFGMRAPRPSQSLSIGSALPRPISQPLRLNRALAVNTQPNAAEPAACPRSLPPPALHCTTPSRSQLRIPLAASPSVLGDLLNTLKPSQKRPLNTLKALQCTNPPERPPPPLTWCSRCRSKSDNISRSAAP
mmetsp:Transcript_16048/g.34444  ORF Transcript_16048/g.34444 Transcript_16048/m.34444 type:complete len:201 (-) Transcript_16048:221-823(-)